MIQSTGHWDSSRLSGIDQGIRSPTTAAAGLVHGWKGVSPQLVPNRLEFEKELYYFRYRAEDGMKLMVSSRSLLCAFIIGING